MVTYLVTNKFDSDQTHAVDTQSTNNFEAKWFTQDMLLDDYETLLGPEPMVFLKFVESEYFNVLPTTFIGDWFSENIQAVKTENDHLLQNMNNNSKSPSFAKSPMQEFLIRYNEKIDNKMPLMTQESLVKTAGIDDDEVSILRHYFYASSFPSRFLSSHNFCSNLCEIILGEMDIDKKKDFYR